MLEQLRDNWRIVVVGVALLALAASALAAGVAVLAQGDDIVRQPVQLPESAATRAPNASAAEGGVSASQQPVLPTPRPPQGAGYHTVKTGETLGKIAAAYGLTTASIANANGLSNPNLIYVGQRLIIPPR